ncbi:MAG TPA: TonB-dependent receptor [Rhizomicrobium sp.]
MRGVPKTGLAWMAAASLAAPLAHAQTVQDLRQMSITELENVDVSSVIKSKELLSNAPAAIYVITHAQIARSGAVTLPEILRLAPNLQVIQTSASKYIITARGFSGNAGDQSYSNKLLVLIDGRSVYTPMFSGVYWDMQDVVPDDIERIEVISGPGATLWGANAVNGVINIITRKASQTQGGLVDISAGNLEQSVTVRYGGMVEDDLAYRAYLTDYIGDDTQNAGGATVHDHWTKPQGGLRLDWTPVASDSVTLQGDEYAGSDAQVGAPNEDIFGDDLLSRWNHKFADGSTLQVQGYFDRTERSTQDNGGTFWVDTYDLEVQHNFALNDWNAIAWGAGVRTSKYRVDGTAALQFAPAGGTLNLSDAFVQDSIALSPSLTAILGIKLEDDPFTSATPLPSARLSWKVTDDALIWAAVSRAIRSPTPFDTDVVEKIGPLTALAGNPEFQSETLLAYELGTRMQPTDKFSFSVSAYYNDYTRLRSIEIDPITFYPLSWGNKLRGDTYGFEAWANYQLADWWQLSASYDALIEHFNFVPSATAPSLGVSQIGDDPAHSATLRSSMNLGAAVTFDADLRYVGHLPDPYVASYVELNANIGWKLTDALHLALSGFNLLHPRHLEFPASEAYAVPRSFAVDLQWRF